jgi:hypothetical protein
MMRRLSFSVVVVAASVVALAACGSEAESTAPASAEGGSATTGGAATGKATPTEVAASVIGMVEDEATAAIDEAGYTWRVLGRDGQDFPATMDFVDTRIGLKITSGKVTEARVG